MMKRYLGVVVALFSLLSSCDPDTSDSPEPQDIFVKLYGSNALEVAEDFVIRNDGGFVIFGTTTSDLYKNIRDSLRVEQDVVIRDFFVVFTDSVGNPEQQLLFNAGISNDGDMEASSIIKTSDGGYLLAGTVSYTVPADGNFEGITAGILIKLTANGAEDWSALTLPTESAEFTAVSQNPVFGLELTPISQSIESVIETSDGNFVLIGTTSDVNINKPDFDVIADISDIWVVKFPPTGFDRTNVLFERKLGFPNEDKGIDIFERSNGSLVLIANGPGKDDNGVDDVLFVSSDANLFNNNFSEFTSSINGDDQVNDATLLSDGGLAVVGTSLTDGQGFLLRISQGGVQQFFNTITFVSNDTIDSPLSGRHEAIAVSQMNNGNLAVIGTALDVLGDNDSPKGNEVLFYNIDGFGDLLSEDQGGFTRTFGGAQDDVGQAVMQLSNGRFMLLVTIDFESNSKMIGLVKTSVRGDLIR